MAGQHARPALRVQELRHAEYRASRIFAQISSHYRYTLSRATISVRSFVRSFQILDWPEERYELTEPFRNSESLREKSPSAAYSTYVATREKSREITRTC